METKESCLLPSVSPQHGDTGGETRRSDPDISRKFNRDEESSFRFTGVGGGRAQEGVLNQNFCTRITQSLQQH